MKKSILPRQRHVVLETKRNQKMATSAHAFVRGSTVQFYEWLNSLEHSIPAGPPVWICGDCHIGNLGPLADSKGRVAVQIRDLDQTVIGNPAYDLVRLSLSLASVTRGSNLPGEITARIVEQIIKSYEAALAGDFDPHGSHRSKNIQVLLRRSVRRRWRQLALERMDTVRPTLPLGKCFWPLSRRERTGLEKMLEEQPVKSKLPDLLGGVGGSVRLMDAAYWMKGCSSLGFKRYAAILRVGGGKDARVSLLDIKEAVSPLAPRAAHQSMPRDNAVRVVTGAKAMSPNIGERMIASKLLGRSVVLRELKPQDLKIDVERLGASEAITLAGYLAGVVGKAHSRQMEAPARAAWEKELRKLRPRTLDAPSWLWGSLLDLLSYHESAYLEHCRTFGPNRPKK